MLPPRKNKTNTYNNDELQLCSKTTRGSYAALTAGAKCQASAQIALFDSWQSVNYSVLLYEVLDVSHLFSQHNVPILAALLYFCRPELSK
jgi:hypothetical protein